MKRILLKLSGEALSGKDSALSKELLAYLATEVKAVWDNGYEIAIVCGGGNILRGAAFSDAKENWSRQSGDQMGMFSTLINSIAINHCLSHAGCPTSLFNSIGIEGVASRFDFHLADEALRSKKIVIAAGGTGNPYFSTDTSAVLRALEVEADYVVKATKVDGVYDKDPMKHKDAIKYTSLTYDEAIEKKLKIMDLTAFTLALENELPIMVYNFYEKGALLKLLSDGKIGTKIHK